MKMPLLIAAASVASLTPGALVAQGLLYTTSNSEVSTQCPGLPQVAAVKENDIEHIVPTNPPAVPAAFQTRQACEVMWGDQDGDGSHHEPALFGQIDAMLPPVLIGGAAIPPNARNVWFSPSVETSALFGAATLHEAELGRMRPNGVLEEFITRAQVHSAFGLPAGVVENVDAAALIWNVGLFLSFETGANINTTFHGAIGVPDGSILAIPFNAIMWGASPYDGAAFVMNVIAGSGVVVLTEPQVDLRVVASSIRDNTGALVVSIDDLDGLEKDPMGGMFFSQSLVEHPFFVGGMIPNLIFCGLNLTGGGIVSTSGNIAVINGVAMGNSVGATTGERLGLVTAGGVGSLNGLGLTSVNQYRFVTDCTEQLLAAGTVNIEVASPPGGLLLLAMQYPAVAGAGLVDASVGAGLLGFPDLYALPPVVFPGPVAAGCATFNLPVSAALYPVVAGSRVLFQAAHLTPGGALALSTPSAVQFY